MERYKKTLLSCLILLITCLFFTSFVNALQNYDQRVYKIESNYKQGEYTNQKVHYHDSCIGRDMNSYNPHPSSSSWNSYNKKSVPTTRLSYSKNAYEDTRKSFFGDYVKEYVVEIKNTGKTGRYFTVTFEIENKRGKIFTQSVTEYLRTGEREKFVYRDIQYEKNEILDWDYTISPEKY